MRGTENVRKVWSFSSESTRRLESNESRYSVRFTRFQRTESVTRLRAPPPSPDLEQLRNSTSVRPCRSNRAEGLDTGGPRSSRTAVIFCLCFQGLRRSQKSSSDPAETSPPVLRVLRACASPGEVRTALTATHCRTSNRANSGQVNTREKLLEDQGFGPEVQQVQ